MKVKDLLDYVTYAGGVGRRRADVVIGLGAPSFTLTKRLSKQCFLAAAGAARDLE